MINTLKKFFSFIKDKIKGSFVLESIFGSIIGIISISLFFALLSHIWPSTYRELTKWANRPLLPIAKMCEINCSQHSPKAFNNKIFRVCAITLTFDIPLKSNEILLVYDPKEKIIINNLNDDSVGFNNKFYNFFGPTANTKVSFIAIGDHEYLTDKYVNFEDCPFKISILED